MAYTKYSLTPADNNAAPPNGAPEGMLPSAVNDTMRDMMSQIRDVGDGIRTGVYTLTAPVITGGSINGTTVGASTASTGSFTTITGTNDASISGLTVGKGGGALSVNTAVGFNVGNGNTTGTFTAVGNRVLQLNTTGLSNVGIGGNDGVNEAALQYNTTGNNNTAVGVSALTRQTTGSNNTAVGNNALLNNTTASNNTAVGYQAGYSNTTGYNQSVLGYQALLSNTTGVQNTAIGQGSLQSNTTANNNTAVGAASLLSNSTGASNSALGFQALYSNTTASNNTAVGYQAGYSNTTGTQNAFFGNVAGYSNTTGTNNTAMGHQALDANTSGDSNTAVGINALGAQTTASSNTAIGVGAGGTITTGTKNTIVGRYDGNQGGLDIRTASNHIVLSDGDGNPRQIIDNNGFVIFGASSVTNADTTQGIFLYGSNGVVQANRNQNACGDFGRLIDDGGIVVFRQAGTVEGSISVSGTTISYNSFAGSHWSQLSDGSKPQILRGTVLESINELVEWPNEPNSERLCRVKISDTAGSKKVYGVFMDWDNDWAATNDMLVTAVGAFVCRINKDVVVQEGDLLESNGDGTARVQSDDIMRSSTIGKVTCTEKTHQFDDGSYCVPTVLYCG